MTKPTIIKLVIALLFALAIALGIVQRSRAPEFQPRSQIKPNQQVAASDKSLSDYYQEASSLTANSQPTTTSANFLAVGDIMLSRNVALAMEKAHDRYYPFGQQTMADLLKSTDFNFANLESPIAQPGKQIIGGHSLIFGAHSDYIKPLVDNNFKILNLANNHALDQGLKGLEYTQEILDQYNIAHEGTGDNLERAWRPTYIESNGVKICFVGASYSSLNDGGKTKNDYVARIEDTDMLKASIFWSKQSSAATAGTPCDFVVVTMHAGTEYTRTPNKAQIAFAHAAIDYGADMVIGAHPHWVQTIERYCPLQSSPPKIGGVDRAASRGGIIQVSTTSLPPSGSTPPVPGGETAACASPKYIFYSLGNFIFDQNFSQDTMEGLAIKIQVTKKQATRNPATGAATLDDLQGPRIAAQLDSIQLIPLIIQNSQPRPATGAEAKKILEKIGEKENILK